MKRIREKPHRLPEAAYFGEVAVSFTACVEARRALFRHGDVVAVFLEILRSESAKHRSDVAIYCFMSDHLHLVLRGQDRLARPKMAMDSFKYLTGRWLASYRPEYEWQRGYHDHIIRNGEDGDQHVIYIAMNPVRAGIVESPLDYPFTGSFATDWKELLSNSRM